MTIEQERMRIDLLQRSLWSFKDIRTWSGVELKTDKQSLLAQFRIWAESRRKPLDTVLDLSGERIHRTYFEWFLQDRGLIPVCAAAAALGMTRSSFEQMIVKGAEKDAPIVTETEARGEYPEANVFRSSFVNNLYTRFPALARFTFSSHSSFCRRLHTEIRSVLGVPVDPLICETSAKLGDDPPEFAHDLDSITDKGMGLPYQFWLETEKPIQLKPDACSWITYLRHERLLSALAHVGGDPFFEEKRHILENAID